MDMRLKIMLLDDLEHTLNISENGRYYYMAEGFAEKVLPEMLIFAKTLNKVRRSGRGPG